MRTDIYIDTPFSRKNIILYNFRISYNTKLSKDKKRQEVDIFISYKV